MKRKTATRLESIDQGKLLRKRPPARKAILVTLTCLLVSLTASYSFGQTKTIIDEWATVQAPKPPALKPVTLDPKTTALLVLDIIKQSCNNQRRPRCVTSVPHIEALLKDARAQGATVIFSVTTSSTPADILKEVAPREGEPIVKASVDKFFKTDLEKILNDKGIKTVVVVGTAAHGVVLYTGSEAALRGLKVIVPVDGMSSENTYYEQYVAYQMANAPGVGQETTLTKSDMIKY
jgi:nicotinamidase-related amidase